MCSRLIFFYLAVIAGVLLLPLTLFAAGNDAEQQPPIAKRYEEAKLYYDQLQSHTNLTSSRDNWLKATRNFRQIYLASPKSDTAPACLLMMGRVYNEMHDHFQKSADLDEAISYFNDTARLFPRHHLADDAYFALGRIYLDKKHTPQKSADFLANIVSNYPKGDMRPMAEDLLKILAKEHNIPLAEKMYSSSGDNNLSSVLPVKYWSSDNYTRVVIKASRPVKYTDSLIEETQNTPRRLSIDFKKSYIDPRYRSPVPIKNGLLRRIRTGQYNADTVRVVLDIESIGDYKIFNLPDPFRVVIDVHGKGHKSVQVPPAAHANRHLKAGKIPNTNQKPDIVVLRDTKKVVFAGNSPAKEPEIEEVSSTAPFSLAQQLSLGVKKIIIDPGHGGKDPGAMAFGLKEKDIVLSIAKKLAPILKKELRCEIVLTRNKDVFIPLEERTAIANTENGDLFVSLHINAHPSAKVRGLETYYLNLTTNDEAMRVAALENATSTHQMSDLQHILSDIMKNSKINESSRLAEQVHNSIFTAIKRNGYADIKNLGIKQAPFYVLIGAEMPAILIEIAFISNEQDAQNLQDPKFLAMVTQEIAIGIQTYVNNTTAQLSLNR